MRWLCVSFALWVLITGSARSDGLCTRQNFQDADYTVCRIDIQQSDLRLFLYDDRVRPWGHFATLDDALFEQGLKLAFAMNAGMYHADRAPVGHYIEDHVEIMRVVPSPGPGNFGLLPNGVLCFGAGYFDVIETFRYLRDKPACRYATQSGPMLVIDGALHPRFLVDSTSRLIRNGVGVSRDGLTGYFVISDDTVTFHQFGRMFRDYLKVDNALFLDGRVSRLHAPDIGRSDFGRWMGPIVGAVVPLDQP